MMTTNINSTHPEEFVARVLAHAFGDGNDETQAALINLLGRALWDSCGRDADKFNSQLCYLERYLDADGRRFVCELAAFAQTDKKGVAAIFGQIPDLPESDFKF